MKEYKLDEITVYFDGVKCKPMKVEDDIKWEKPFVDSDKKTIVYPNGTFTDLLKTKNEYNLTDIQIDELIEKLIQLYEGR